ncbi:MAG: M28 family peptidase [Chloroflexi bacterium]|nr:M28 family peptidase [Chloroflexota bacterium]MCI0833881.1 M28 family peptidase [Chloroflexota bacterium]MCI0837160.1 M28 family peptidase [Chloroflexota bacterium]
MTVDWPSAESSLMGNAWVCSRANDHVNMLCDSIGVRWGGSEGERRAAEYIRSRFEEYGLQETSTEEFEVDTWEATSSSISIDGEDDRILDVRPSLFCPSVTATAPIVDVGFGMAHEVGPLTGRLDGAIALISGAYEPFSPPESLTIRLERLATLGVVACITPYAAGGRRTSHGHAGDWRDDDPNTVSLPLVHTSREDGALLARRAASGATVTLQVDSQRTTATSRNAMGDLAGDIWPDEWLVLGAHHDTTVDSPGANDNASGSTVVLEVARLLAQLKREQGIGPGRSIRFVTFGSEEQGLQGSAAYVERHYGPDPMPRLMVNLDELGTGSMKGVVLQFPELRPLIQKELDAMGEGLKCHVLAQMDATGDGFPFARKGIQAAMLWRWRFVGRHPDVAFGHSSSDTVDKVRIRELKEYAGFLARLMLRVSHTTPEEWPQEPLDTVEIKARIAQERGSVVRTM